MLSILKKKRVRLGLGLLALLAFAGVAVAYFTASGSGTGTATAGNSTPMTISATITPGTGGIVPGGNPATVNFSVNNPSSGNQYVNTISLSSTTPIQAYNSQGQNITGTGANQCDTSQFSMAPVSVGQDVGPGSNNITPTGSLVFHDEATVNQSGCEGASLVATFSSN